ncbi:MAG: hypothetical protein OXM62_10305 [bacterium]|nr:hypothetical protein [bacterium]MDE0235389.1 hypothetical protein [bacterium]
MSNSEIHEDPWALAAWEATRDVAGALATAEKPLHAVLMLLEDFVIGMLTSDPHRYIKVVLPPAGRTKDPIWATFDDELFRQDLAEAAHKGFAAA